MTQTLRGAAGVARHAGRRLLRMARLIGRDTIVARRCEGALGGAGPARPLTLFYVGHEVFAGEFARYFASPRSALEQGATVFRGSLAQFLMHRVAIAREASDADVVACEAFPGGIVHEDDVEHYPMLDGVLRVEETMDRQIRRVRSRAERRLMRDLLRRGVFQSWVDSGPEAFARFHSTLYAPYARARFGEGAAVNESEPLRRLYARNGRILFVARRERPREPVCGTLLLDRPERTLAYRYNGFVLGAEMDGPAMAERTAALELAVVEHAIARRFTRIAFGYTRAFLNDGIFTHKRRVGCTFVPLSGSPLFRLRVQAGRRATIFARFPILVGRPPDWTALLGFDDSLPKLRKSAWRSVLKNYRVAGLDKAVIWTNTHPGRESDLLGETAFREAVDEILDVPAGVEFRSDGDGASS